jgi:SAM-dependent methyltransferase
MVLRMRLGDSYAGRLKAARERTAYIDKSRAHDEFVEVVRSETPWRFNGGSRPERYLRNVEHHLVNFVPKLLACLDRDIHTVFDFGCGSGSGSIALAMMLPGIRCQGVDISAAEVSIGRARAALYGVGERCQFDVIQAGQTLPVPSDAFDLCICCSVLEYLTDPAVRKLCVQEMARAIMPGGLLFMTVPNRLYPIEVHSHKLGWNYFPRLLKARIVGSSEWEVRAMVHPHVLRPYHTPLLQLFTPWTNFCLRKVAT